MSGGSAAIAFLVGIVTNYVTAELPEWAENTVLVWSAFGALAVVSLGLFFWERRLAAGPPDGGVRPVPLGRIAAGGHSMNPPTVSARVRGREAELERIGAQVRGPGGGMVVVCGAGGLGKTTLAAEASARAQAEGRVVVWIRWRDDPAQLGQDLAQAAHILGLPEDRLEEARTGRVSLVDAVWEHLATVKGWVIVVDNVDTPTQIGPGPGPLAAYRGWLRPHGGGVLLVTSRDTTRQTWGPDADLIHLQPLADDAGGTVLMDAAPHAGTETEAEALAARLGGLPLGLNAAGTYLSVPTSRHRTFAAYQHALEAEFADLLGAEHPGAATDPAVARRVVRHTWDLSLDQLHQDGYTLARTVLQLLALFEPAPVPRTLMTPELVTDATGLPATAADVDAALAGLHQYGLLHTPGADGPGDGVPPVNQVRLHPLVRDVTAHTLTRPEPTDTWLTAIDDHLTRAVDVVAGMPGRTGWPTARLLALHLRSHLDRRAQRDFTTAVGTLDDLARVLNNAGAASEELLLRRQVLDAETRALGPDHPDTLASRNNLANALSDLGEYQQAAELCRQNVADRERVLGPDRPDTLASRNNLANALDDLGEHQQAAELHQQTLTARERVLGPDHPDTLASRNNLAVTLHSLGELQQAAELHQQTLTARERVLGPDHPDTLISRSNLAVALDSLGEHQQAADLHRRILTARERALGPDHPDTLASRNNLANALDDLGEHQLAADLYRRILADRERVLGPGHPNTLSTRNNLANALHSLGEHQQAADLYHQTLTDYERVLGSHHPRTLSSRSNLAVALHSLGELQQAAELHHQTLTDRERVLGPDHPHTLDSRNNLDNALNRLAEVGRRRWWQLPRRS
ncbi:FxSxx-COOH system tetratricopeptide repeat protein [Streptomyces anulatus]|uniref:FxSxx-COOH system tetratricopeptide repeat protein n=1 Tax=Streptomyces anulatus TaxID=1892 RepID=UPI002E7FEED1|nr:FxSxx-COOH system tetratricopeptide repeat protein [Streptomyces anulatus]WUC92075.1 FxSxx-COOH system tetratricopeptide repeat protein [Streptomyces anulatus]